MSTSIVVARNIQIFQVYCRNVAVKIQEKKLGITFPEIHKVTTAQHDTRNYSTRNVLENFHNNEKLRKNFLSTFLSENNQ